MVIHMYQLQFICNFISLEAQLLAKLKLMLQMMTFLKCTKYEGDALAYSPTHCTLDIFLLNFHIVL